MLTLKNLAITLLLLTATAFSAWSIIISHPAKVNPQDDPKQIDSFMEEVQAITYNKLGQPSLQITTPKMVHYPENNTTYITTPRVIIYRQSPQPWFVDSDYAKASNGMDSILFWSNVNIHHLADPENPTTSLRTNTLTIFPNQQIAQTNEAVTFVQPDTTVHAIGMLANLDVGTVKLLSQTQGEYDPSS
ncbi:MAG: LPS export ABC transporter periplasmic protein LptC [Pseudomonadota bacterium]